MKFDRSKLATVLAVSAAALAGCEDRQCVDAKGKVVPSSYCGGGQGGGVHPGFFFVPIGRFGGGGGGSMGAVSRGGFGGEGGAGHGGGGGE